MGEASWYDLYKRKSASIGCACSCEPAEESVGEFVSVVLCAISVPLW